MPTTDMLPVMKYIAANEFDWWHNKLTQAKVRKLIFENTGVKIGREKGEFKDFCAENMSIYGHWKRKPKSTNLDLTESQWDRLKIVVACLQSQIEGQGLDVAFDIIRTKISTNTTLLLNLPRRLHYWTCNKE